MATSSSYGSRVTLRSQSWDHEQSKVTNETVWDKVLRKIISNKAAVKHSKRKQTKRRRVGVAGPCVETVSDSYFKTSCENRPGISPENGSNDMPRHTDKLVDSRNNFPDDSVTRKISTFELGDNTLVMKNKSQSNGHVFNMDMQVNGFINGDTPTDYNPKSTVTEDGRIWNIISAVKPSFKWSLFSKKEPESMTSNYDLKRKNSSEQFAHLTLLTPALILHPAIHGEDALTPNFSNKLGSDFQLQLAAAHINDAMNGRGKFGEARAIFKPPHIQKCFQIISSKWWAALLYLVIAVHSLLIIWEQSAKPVGIGQEWVNWSIHPAVVVVNAVCLLIYIVDVVLHVLFFTWNNVWHAKEAVWIRVEFIFLCLFIVDYIILIVEAITNKRLLCPFRCFRASMLLCKSKNVAHIFNVLVSIISKLGKVFLIIAIFIVTFASIGLHIFMDYYHNLEEPCHNATANCTNIYDGAFNQVASAALHMFVLMSTENYPEFIIPAFTKGWANFFYYGLYLYAGVFFLTAILLAIIVESYWDYSKRHVKQERRQQREELAKAWNLMDPRGKGQLSVRDRNLIKLFEKLKPKNTPDENLELINYISMYGDGVIDSFDWTTRLIEALSFEFEEEPDENDQKRSETSNNRTFIAFQKMCRYIMHARAVSVGVLVLIFIHSILFCLMWVGISDLAQLSIQSTRTSIVAVFCFEILFRWVADGRELLNVFDVLDMLLVLFAAVGDITWYVLWYRNPRPSAIYLGACVVVSGLSVLVRAIFNSQHARLAVRVLQNIYPVMFDLILLVITIIFNFAVIGLEIFQDKTLEASSARGYEGSYVEYGCGVGFETFGCSLLIIFQIVTTNDWHEIMLGAMIDAGWPSAFYFIACYLMVDMIVINLLVAISIEAYKKLAIDNPSSVSNSPENEDYVQNSKSDIKTQDENSFTSAARNTLNDIFASSRKSRQNVGSSSLTGFASSPYAVRRGTLGSLGQRTPTPSPRVNDNQNRSSITRPSVRIENVADSPPSSPPNSKPGKRSIDRRQKALKERQQLKKERRRTKQEEMKVSAEVKSDLKLRIDDVVKLKMAVRVVRAYRARNSQEMNLTEGELIEVTEKSEEMLRGPAGWFPVDHVTDDIGQNQDQNWSNMNLPHVIVVNNQEPGRQTRVQFDVQESVPDPSKKPRQGSPRHRVSQTRMKRKTDGADWRREIHGDMTVMNKDEMQDLSKMIRGGLERRHTTHLRSVPSQLALRLNEQILEEEEEITVPRLTVSEVVPEPQVVEKEEPNRIVTSDTNTLTLPQEVHPRRRMSRKKTSGDGSMPEWAQKFVSEKQIAFDEDAKFEDGFMSTASSEEDRDVVRVNVVAPKRRTLRRKDSRTPPRRRALNTVKKKRLPSPGNT